MVRGDPGKCEIALGISLLAGLPEQGRQPDLAGLEEEVPAL
jgi:hypothetical protein